MMENAIYSVISPEGCAAILWKDASQAPRAADCLRLTAEDLKRLAVIDEIIPEAFEWRITDDAEGAESVDEVTANLKNSLLRHLQELLKFPASQRLRRRYEKFRKIGDFL
jgi:acetyl-CoA carboxylase carboxyl transferase subunit alpha